MIKSKTTDFGPGYFPIDTDINISDFSKSNTLWGFVAAAIFTVIINTIIAYYLSKLPWILFFLLYCVTMIPFGIGSALAYYTLDVNNVNRLRISLPENNKVYQDFSTIFYPQLHILVLAILVLLSVTVSNIIYLYFHDGYYSVAFQVIVFFTMLYTQFILGGASKAAFFFSESMMIFIVMMIPMMLCDIKDLTWASSLENFNEVCFLK